MPPPSPPTPTRPTGPTAPALTAPLGGPGELAAVDLARAALMGPGGRPLLTPVAARVARWDLLDRSPVSVRLAGVSAAGTAEAWCRYELKDGGVSAEVVGASFVERSERTVFIPAGG